MNDFQIISKLGEGAYSIVYKVKRWVDDQIYAWKKVKLMSLSEKEKQNALNEVRILASVKSAFVVCYKEAFFDEKDNTLGIVMEYADKGDLYQKIVEHKKKAIFFEESDIWRILIQLVKGLKALHDLKILHRDLKSANVFLNSDGSAKLGDLNVSKVAKKGLASTQTGTPYYASPEVWKDQPYNNKSDIWSLGCVWYEMITWRPPFRAENMEGLYNKVIKGQISKLPERFSSDLQTIIKLWIQVAPDNRPSCEQLLKHPIILKRIEYFKAYASDEVSEDQAWLQTIRIPKNMWFLSDKLPRPNYEKSIVDPTKNYRSFSNQRDWELKKKEPWVNLSSVNINSVIMGKWAPINQQQQQQQPKSTILKLQMEKAKSKENVDSRNINYNSNIHINSNSLQINPRVISPKYRVNIQSGKRRIESIYKGNVNNALNNKADELPQLNIISSKKKVLSNNNNELNMLNRMNNNHSNSRSNDHWNDWYKIYAPYINNPAIRYKKYIANNKANNNPSVNYLNNWEKYYDNVNLNKQKKYNAGVPPKEGPENKMVPKRKWSPIKRNVINIC